MLTFDPFRDLDRLGDQLLRSGQAAGRVPRFMPIDLYRSGDHFVLHADLPGIDELRACQFFASHAARALRVS